MRHERSLTGKPWAVSLHGGHSSEFCDHASSTLREILEAAVDYGYHTFGVAEHAPRVDPKYLYAEEVAMGWDVDKIMSDFGAYAFALDLLAEEFADRITVLRGFEAEVVPPDRYAEVMLGLRHRFGFDYIVGSVHWVDDIIIDYTKDEFDRAVTAHGGIGPLALRYYEIVAEMVRALEPEVVAHLDLIRKFAGPRDATETPAVRRAAGTALEAIREHGCILEVNTVGLRKGLGAPYPAPWLVRLAADMGIGFCFGDDSHCSADVGAGIAEARDCLLQNRVDSITVLTREGDAIGRRLVALD